MSYELYFWCLMAFIVGRISANFKIYIGQNKQKYEDATIGILLK